KIQAVNVSGNESILRNETQDGERDIFFRPMKRHQKESARPSFTSRTYEYLEVYCSFGCWPGARSPRRTWRNQHCVRGTTSVGVAKQSASSAQNRQLYPVRKR